MESTGKYWVLVFSILEKRGIRVVIDSPKWIKAVKGNKDDTKDSRWIGDLFRIGTVRDHLHYIEKLIERVDLCIHAMVEKYGGAISILCTIPGISQTCAGAIYPRSRERQTGSLLHTLKHERSAKRR